MDDEDDDYDDDDLVPKSKIPMKKAPTKFACTKLFSSNAYNKFIAARLNLQEFDSIFSYPEDLNEKTFRVKFLIGTEEVITVSADNALDVHAQEIVKSARSILESKYLKEKEELINWFNEVTEALKKEDVIK